MILCKRYSRSGNIPGTIPICETASIAVTTPVTVTVQSQTGPPYPDLPVYAFSGESYTGFNGTIDANGQVVFTLPVGDYRFRSDLNGTQFWSGEANHCAIPGCESTSITVTIPMTVTVQSQIGSPYPDLPVYAFSGESYTGFHGTSDADGQVVFTLPVGDYRFRLHQETIFIGKAARSNQQQDSSPQITNINVTPLEIRLCPSPVTSILIGKIALPMNL